MKTNEEIIYEIEDYVGGNIEGVKDIDRMSFTRFLRKILTAKDAEWEKRIKEVKAEEYKKGYEKGREDIEIQQSKKLFDEAVRQGLI